MRTGRRTANPDDKRLQGTYRGDRHGDIVTISNPAQNIPVPPAYLSREAKLVWDEELPRVVSCGCTEADSSLLARYCVAEATFRGMAAKVEPISAALMTELRRSAELLGIGGLRSRLAKIGGGDAAKTSAFSTRPN